MTDAPWNGLPPHPERPGYHWLSNLGQMLVAEWLVNRRIWAGSRFEIAAGAHMARWRYLGTCLPPVDASVPAPLPVAGQVWRSTRIRTEAREIVAVSEAQVIYATSRYPAQRIRHEGWRTWVKKSGARPDVVSITSAEDAAA